MNPDDTDERRVDDDEGESESEGDVDPTDDSNRDPLEDGDGFDDEFDDGFDGEFDEEDLEDGIRTTADEVDQRIVDLLSWILDTETRAKIYVFLLANPGSTSEEVAKGTGLYPSTVREALAELHDEERVTREKRESQGAGNNPYEYTAIQPSELVGGVVDQVQQELNAIFTLDRVLDRERDGAGADTGEPAFADDVEPVTITVEETDPLAGEDDGDGDGDRDGNGDDADTGDGTEADDDTAGDR
ncbi:Sugar-specific transcriptional regulator TrmB [Halobiforma haloterrestris]|uniref:Sugar-specific transcriptional regulator TrmB n=1 Tax=Natronobacterium haloterrestre TaxID=148448 RepID=A0A1I1IUT0_NATHA|nr:helix-turn-helix domain-containing protein [Halobiforma haloterrestris]SFC36980.1 Sugar-specific transcriptional regulator TrmB [Halobiforma haloterrestris]